MGKSRSATVLLAYLLWASRQGPTSQMPESSEDTVPLPPKPLSVVQALEILRQGRPFAEPNEGFMDQLHLYQDMGCPTTEDEMRSHRLFRRWMNKRQVTESLRSMQAPDLDYIVFEDESSSGQDNGHSPQTQRSGNTRHMAQVLPGVSAPDGSYESQSAVSAQSQSSSQVSIKCRKCRHVLATTPFIVEHKPPPHRDPSSEQQQSGDGAALPPPQCAHIFLHPLSWMREVLAEGKMESRLTCPNKKCNTNVGKFAWSGLRCSCGGWVTPGFGVTRAKIDENIAGPGTVRDSTGALNDTSGAALVPGVAALRLPPNMKRHGNL